MSLHFGTLNSLCERVNPTAPTLVPLCLQMTYVICEALLHQPLKPVNIKTFGCTYINRLRTVIFHNYTVNLAILHPLTDSFRETPLTTLL